MRPAPLCTHPPVHPLWPRPLTAPVAPGPFVQGEFEWKLPVVGTWITYKDPEGRPPCDWWGINFYSRCVLTWSLQPSCMPSEVMTDM